MKVIGNLNIENKLQVGNLNVPTFNMEVDGGDNEIHAKFYGNYSGNQGILVERSGGDNVKLLAGYTGYGGGLESKSALRFSVGGNNLSTPAVEITETSVVNISEYIKFPYVNSTNTVTPNIPNVATKKTAIWMDMEGDESYLEYGHVDGGQTYTQFRVTDNNVGDRFRIYIDDWQGDANDKIPLDVRGDRVLLSQDGGNVGIGTDNPTHKLHVEGSVKIVDGTEGSDKVLTSDADGLGTWQNISSLMEGMVGDTNNYVTAANIGGNTLILKRNGGLGDLTVDLSQFMDDTNTDTYVIGGEVIKGAGDCNHKIRLNLNNGSFIAGAIDVSSLASDNYVSDLTLVGSQLTLKQSNECGNEKPTFQVDLSPLTSGLNTGGDNDWTVLGNNMHSTPSGLVGIGIVTPNHKLHVAEDSGNDILHVDSSHSSFSYGGASGIGNKTNNVILKHKDTGGDNTSSSWQTRGSDDKVAIELTTYFNNSGTEISYNAIAMHAAEGKVSILAADNDADDAILSIQSDSKIGFQNNSTSWPSGKLETMTIDLTTDRVGINEESPDCSLHIGGQIKIVDGTQSQGKVLTSNADGLASWQIPAGGSSFPVGSIIQFAGDTAPAGWLMCDGSLKNTLYYGVLYSVIGTTYGVGESEPGFGGEPIEEGGDTFRVPNLNGRVPVGKDSNDSDFDSLGEKKGTKEESLKENEIPHKSHKHTINDSGSGHHHPIGWVHDGEAGIKTDGSGSGKAHHVLNAHATKSLNVFQDYVITGNHTFTDGESVGCQSSLNIANTPFQDVTQGEHSHSMTSGSPDDGSVVTAHNNLQPYIVLNYIIYASV